MRILLLFLIASIAWADHAAAETPFSFNTAPGKLPKTIRPLHYAIVLAPEVKTLSTAGTVTIDFEALQPVREIVLNALDLTIDQASLAEAPNEPLTPQLDAKKQLLTLPLTRELPAGRHRLFLAFRGKIVEQPEGLFYNKYDSPTGEKILLSTQMEPTDARRMFPCWDEPIFRATFQLMVTVPASQTAVSNTPILHENTTGDLKTIAFAPTPSMASYLMVLAIGEFEQVEGEQDGVKLRILTTAGKMESARYALESTKRLLHFYNDYFGTPYPLPKLDQIALPGGFGGAMENWGAITYNETNLLYDPAKSPQETKQRVFEIIAHEIAHQWFGNLVTMAWWDNLWLNEGFASWMGTKATDHFNPEWEAWLSANLEKNHAMRLDARKTTHPIQTPVANESEAMDAFDKITYFKGQSFIRMLEHYLGEEAFRNGIRDYLKTHAYSNTTTADLWQALEAASGKEVAKMASAWTSLPGFPVVSVAAECVDNKRIVQLAQERFTLNDPRAKPLLWPIPVTLKAATEEVSAFLDHGPTTATLPNCASVVLANAGDHGYFRIQYSDELAAAIQKNITTFSPADRLTLVSDTFALVEAGRVAPARWLDLVAALAPAERTLAIWQKTLEGLASFDDLMRGSPERAELARFAIRILRPAFDRSGWEAKEGESRQDKVLRNDLLEALARYGDAGILAEAKSRFQKSIADPASLPGDLRASVLYAVGRGADEATYEQLRSLAKEAPGTEEKRQYYSAMQASLNAALAAQTLELTLGEEIPLMIRTSNISQVANAGGHETLAWDFTKTHVDFLLGQTSSFARNKYLGRILEKSADPKKAEELTRLSSEKLLPEAQPTTARFADGILFQAVMKETLLPGISRWLELHADEPPR